MDRPVARSVFNPPLMVSLAARSEALPLLAITRATSRVLVISSSGVKTLLTRPISFASAAVRWRPVKTISLVRLAPISRARRWVPPKPGMRPSVISGSPKRAFSEA